MKHTPQRCLKIAIKNRSCKCQSVVEFYIHESSQNENLKEIQRFSWTVKKHMCYSKKKKKKVKKHM